MSPFSLCALFICPTLLSLLFTCIFLCLILQSCPEKGSFVQPTHLCLIFLTADFLPHHSLCACDFPFWRSSLLYSPKSLLSFFLLLSSWSWCMGCRADMIGVHSFIGTGDVCGRCLAQFYSSSCSWSVFINIGDVTCGIGRFRTNLCSSSFAWSVLADVGVH